MNSAFQTLQTPTLCNALWPRAQAIKPAVLVIGGSLALALSAKIQVPFWPVPMTMQSLVVLLIGFISGSRLGALTLLAYLAEGFVGLPVFAGAAAGPAYMAGPTGGYLLGFLLGATFVGWLAERGWDRDLQHTAVAMTLGHVLLFVPGVLWLAVLFGWTQALALGVTPFIAATILKTGLGVGIIAALWALVRRRQSISC